MSTTDYSGVEMGGLSKRGYDDPNHIHFVSVGRVKDGKILISAITNRRF